MILPRLKTLDPNQMPKQYLDIIQGKTCNYCGESTVLVNSKGITGTQSGNIYHCETCNAYVGVHIDTLTQSKGSVANATLRRCRIEAHKQFDKLWQGKQENTRALCYKWMSQVMQIDPAFAHIGLMSEEECLELTRLVEQALAKFNLKKVKITAINSRGLAVKGIAEAPFDQPEMLSRYIKDMLAWSGVASLKIEPKF